ncbi:MAG TPA: DUF5818 domain-containing protein [Thermoanaerobaculia bacterium]
MPARIGSLARGSRLPLLLAAALSLPACYVGPPPGYHPSDRPYDDDRAESGPADQPVDQIDGFVTFEGRCPTLREHGSDEIFALTGNTRALRPGDHVRLSEREAEENPCGGDAPTLEVTRIEAIWQGDGHRDAYFDARRDGDLDRFLSASRSRGGWYAERYAYRTGNVDRPGEDRRDQSPPYVPNIPDQPNQPDDPNGRSAEPAPPPGAPDRPDMDSDDDEEREQLSVTGRLELGGQCPVIRTPQGDSWDVIGDLGDYRNGDRVNVIGVATGRSACGGRALTISEIRGR